VSNQFRGGTRLQAHWYVTSDGNWQFLGFHDLTLDLDCTFAPTASGWRCIPDIQRSFIAPQTPNGKSYDDSACTEEVGIQGWLGLGKQASKYILSLAPPGQPCTSTATRVFAAGTPKSVDGIYTFQNGQCVKTYVDSYVVAPLGAELTTSMALGNVAQGTAEGGVARATLSTEDGASAFVNWVDTTANAPCTFRVAADGATRCLPDGPGGGNGSWGDPTCSAPAIIGTCAPPAFLQTSDTQCPARRHVFPYANTTGTSYIGSAGGSCIGVPVNVGQVHVGGPESAASSFVLATPAAPSGTGRLQSKDLAVSSWKLRAPAQAPSFPSGQGEWHDTQRNVDCAFAPAADGVPRCLPHAMRTIYADASCATPLGVQESSNACDVTSYASSDDGSTVPARTHIYPVTAPFSGTTVYAKPDGVTCQAFAVSGSSELLFSLGPEAAPSTFQDATEVFN
jgi:hypothetical protein